MRWLLDTLHICACGLDAPFVSIGDILTKYAHSKSVEIVINQGTLWMIVHFQTLPWNRWPMSSEREHLCKLLWRESIVLEPGA